MNTCILKAIGMFTLGTVVGSVVTNEILKVKYENYATQEIEEYKNYILDQVADGELIDKEDMPENVVITKDEFTQELEEHQNDIFNKMSNEGSIKDENIFKISNELFTGTREAYHKDILVYRPDNDTVLDINGKLIEDSESLIGPNALSDLINLESSCIYIRNSNIHTDYKIIYAMTED